MAKEAHGFPPDPLKFKELDAPRGDAWGPKKDMTTLSYKVIYKIDLLIKILNFSRTWRIAHKSEKKGLAVLMNSAKPLRVVSLVTYKWDWNIERYSNRINVMTNNNNSKKNFMEPEMTRSTSSSKNLKTILFPIRISQ